MSLNDHARLAPSSAPRNVPCPGSLQMEANYPEVEDSEDSLNGTAAHWVWDQVLNAGVYAKPGDMAPNGVIITDEMIDGANLFISEIDDICRTDARLVNQLHVEQRVDISVLHPDCWGTPDAWIWDVSALILYILDYKFGHGYVNVFGHWQLIDYAAGILEYLGINGLKDQLVKVVFVVVQPRYYHVEGPVRTWEIKASDLRGYFNVARTAYDEATGPSPRVVSGNHCTHCRARHACPAYKNAAMASIDYVDRASPEPLDDVSLGVELRILEDAQARITGRLKALTADAEGRFRNGRSVAGWGTLPTYGNLKWAREQEEILMLGMLNGVELRKTDALITPTQARDRKLLSPDVIAQYTERPKNGYKLVKSENSLAMRAFKKVSQNEV